MGSEARAVISGASPSQVGAPGQQFTGSGPVWVHRAWTKPPSGPRGQRAQGRVWTPPGEGQGLGAVQQTASFQPLWGSGGARAPGEPGGRPLVPVAPSIKRAGPHVSPQPSLGRAAGSPQERHGWVSGSNRD